MQKGQIASKGYAIGKAFLLTKEELTVKEEPIENIEEAIESFQQAVQNSEQDLLKIKDNMKDTLDSEHLEIFDAHLQMIKDPEIKKQTEVMIEADHIHPSFAYKKVTDQFITIFQEMDDPYFKERASDIKDIQYRVLSYLLDKPIKDATALEDDTIIIAHDLVPSDTASLDLNRVKGFITEVGGITSHTAIMARAFQLPAIVGVSNAVNTVKDGDLIIVDAINHDIIINPSDEEVNTAKKALKDLKEKEKALMEYQSKPTIFKDGKKLPLYANIGSEKDIPFTQEQGAEGIGLFRTEFLFMDRTMMPKEEDQIKAYEKVFKAYERVIVRTLDIGGDKSLPYLDQAKEDNPFLGHRAIRLCFEEKEMFKTQLRALMRAAKDSKQLDIMFPMIARKDELLKAKAILEEAKKSLDKENLDYQKTIKVGIMIEIPSAALNARSLAKEVDFFSIGTNDLIQYTYAADRMNDQVSYLYEPFDPTLLRLIHDVVSAAHKEDVEVGVCGEMAGDLHAGIILAGLGIDELSMSAGSILPLRKAFSEINFSDLKQTIDDFLQCDDAECVKDIVKPIYNE